MVVVDLGKWEVETELQPPLTMEEVSEMTQMELEERLYHRLLVQCSDIQVLFTDSGKSLYSNYFLFTYSILISKTKQCKAVS